MADLGGVRVGIAFEAAALDAFPAFTYITAQAGVRVQRIMTKRGRSDERSKIDIGTATVTGLDTLGVLDPTNASGPFYGNLDPTKQAIVELQNPITGAWSPIFRGHVADWTFTLDPSESFIQFQLDLVDALDILEAAEVVPDQAGNTVPAESVGDCFYTGQQVDDRILAAIFDAATTLFGVAWPATLLHIFSGNVNVQGTVYPARSTLLQVCQDAADAEFPGVGVFFAAKDGSLTFHGRYARFQPEHYETNGILMWKAGDAAAFKLDPGVAVASALEFTRGKTNLINAALAYPNGIFQGDIAGQLADDSSSIGTYATRSISFENLITEGGVADGRNAKQETKLYGQYYVDNFKLPRTRVSKITWTTQDPDGTRGAAVWPLMCGIDLSHLVKLTTSHPGGGGFGESFFVESLAYDIQVANGRFSQVQLVAEVSPQAYYDIAFPS